MMYLDLEELPSLFAGRWLWSSDHVVLAQFRRTDHVGDPHVSHPCRAALRRSPRGPNPLADSPALLRLLFNPVSFYFCYDATGRHVETIVAEIINTPWNERYCYILGEDLNEAKGTKKRYRFGKTFHVSPFIDMDNDYYWRFCEPEYHLTIHMENRSGNGKLFDATMTLRRHELTGPALAAVLLHYPFMTGKVIAAIYWQAFRLWWKNTPVYDHPRKRGLTTEGQGS